MTPTADATSTVTSEKEVTTVQKTKVLVTGAGGFIGHRLVAFLREKGYWVRGVDLKHPEFAPTQADEFEIRDLRRWPDCLLATRDVDEVYALAADMGGMGFIETHKADCMLAVMINTNMLLAARDHRVERYFFSSSACVTLHTSRPAPTSFR